MHVFDEVQFVSHCYTVIHIKRYSDILYTKKNQLYIFPVQELRFFVVVVVFCFFFVFFFFKIHEFGKCIAL